GGESWVFVMRSRFCAGRSRETQRVRHTASTAAGAPAKKRSGRRFGVAEMYFASVCSRPRSLAQLPRQTMSSVSLSPCTSRKSPRSSARPRRQSSTLLACNQPRPRHTSTGVTNPCRAKASAAAATTREFRLLLLTLGLYCPAADTVREGGDQGPFGRNLRREAERAVRPGPGCPRR